FTSEEDGGAFTLDFVPGRVQPIQLRPVLDRPQRRLRVQTVAEPLAGRTGADALGDGVVEVLVNEEALQRNATLATEQEHAPEQRLGDGFRVRVRQNDAGVVSP